MHNRIPNYVIEYFIRLGVCTVLDCLQLNEFRMKMKCTYNGELKGMRTSVLGVRKFVRKGENTINVLILS